MSTQKKYNWNDIEMKEKLNSFFEQNLEIIISFYKLMYEKINLDSFFNLEPFINPKTGINKSYFRDRLSNSRFKILYDNKYPETVEDLLTLWKEYINDNIKDEIQLSALTVFRHNLENKIYKTIKRKKTIKDKENYSFFDYLYYLRFYKDSEEDYRIIDLLNSISEFEAYAIVFWIFRLFDNIKERSLFVVYYLKIKLSELFGFDFEYMENDIYIMHRQNVVCIEIINSLNSLMQKIDTYTKVKINKRLYYRGHSNPNYKVFPGVYRDINIEENESKIYNLMKIENPKIFNECKSHLDEISIMQHYGIATRILDITSNILVALFFSCNEDTTHGEFIVFDIPDSFVKFNRSPEVSLLSSLSALDYKYKKDFLNSFITGETATEAENRLAYEVKLENPSWNGTMTEKELSQVYFVSPDKRTPRIIRQSGAFFLFGLYLDIKLNNPLDDCRLKDNEGKKVVFIIKKNAKNEIIEQLKKFNINQATLFPEVENIAKHIMKSYQSML